MDINNGHRISFEIEFVLVSEENIDEVAEWTGGKINSDDEGRYVRLQDKNIIRARQAKAYAGDYVVRHRDLKSFRVYNRAAFWRNFVSETSENLKEHMDREQHEADRSAVTGQFVTHEEALENPDTTVHETFES